MPFKSLKLVAVISACLFTTMSFGKSLDVSSKSERAKVTSIDMVAQDSKGQDIHFNINAGCGQGYDGIGKIIMSEQAAKDEALLLRYKYGPQTAKQFINYWNTKVTEDAPRLPTVAMIIYPQKDHPLADLLRNDKDSKQRLADLNDNGSYKIMVAADEQSNHGGEIIVIACGKKEHLPISV